jgi:hypothetical protein
LPGECYQKELAGSSLIIFFKNESDKKAADYIKKKENPDWIE